LPATTRADADHVAARLLSRDLAVDQVQDLTDATMIVSSKAVRLAGR
jgi:hypothetical protein